MTTDGYKRRAAAHVIGKLTEDLEDSTKIHEMLGLLSSAHRNLQVISAGCRHPGYERSRPTVEHYTAPAAWAPYLVHGDSTGLENIEQVAIDDWMGALSDAAGGSVVVAGVNPPVEQTEFRTLHDAYSFWPYAADCCTYVTHILEK